MADTIDLTDVTVIGDLKRGVIVWTDDFTASRNSENLWEGSESYYVYQPYLVNNIPNRGGACRHPGFDFLKCDSVELANESGGIYKVTVQFKGYYTITGGGDGGSNDKNVDLQITLNQEPLLSHKEFAIETNISDAEKEAIRGLLDGKWEAVDASSSKYVLQKFGDEATSITVTSDEGKKFVDYIFNGVTSYLLPQQVFRYSYMSDELPSASLLNDVGKIKDPPAKSDAPAVSSNRNWLFMGVSCSQYGDDVFQITEEYMLSGLGGWDEFLYEES